MPCSLDNDQQQPLRSVRVQEHPITGCVQEIEEKYIRVDREQFTNTNNAAGGVPEKIANTNTRL